MRKLVLNDIITIGGFSTLEEFNNYLINNNINCIDLQIENQEGFLVMKQCAKGNKTIVEKRTFKDLSTETAELMVAYIENGSNFLKIIDDSVFQYMESIGQSLRIYQ